MIRAMTPERYEEMCNAIITRMINFVIWLAVSTVIFFFYLIIGVLVFDFTPSSLHFSAFIVSPLAAFLIVSFLILQNRIGLTKIPFIYWWIVLFGYKTSSDKFVKSACEGDGRYLSATEKLNSLKKYLADNDAGLYYADIDNLRGDSAIYFADKKRAMMLILGIGGGKE